MKKILLVFALASVCVAPTQVIAQNLSLDETSITVWGPYDDFEIVSHMNVHNNGSTDIEVKVKRVEVELAAGMDNAICWELCYTPNISESPTSLTIPADSLVNNFSGHLYPNQNDGTTRINYVFWDVANPNDSVVLSVTYIVAGLSIEEEDDAFSIYPNPTTGVLNIDLNTTDNVQPQVFYVLGQQLNVRWNRISSTRIQADLSALPRGMYFVKHDGHTERVVLN